MTASSTLLLLYVSFANNTAGNFTARNNGGTNQKKSLLYNNEASTQGSGQRTIRSTTRNAMKSTS